MEKLHATIVARRGVFLLEAHGLVLLDGRPVGILAPTALADRDVLTLGGQTLEVQLPRILAHGGVPDHLHGLPLGLTVALLHLGHALAADRADACVREVLRGTNGVVLARSATSAELLFDDPGEALVAGLALVRELGALAGPDAGVRLGADLAPLDVARADAARAMAASTGHLVATDSFTGRALHASGRLERDGRDLLLARLAPDVAAPELVLFMIADD